MSPEGISPVRRRMEIVTGLIQAHRYTWQNETELQGHLHRVFTMAGLPVQREVRLNPADRPDFLIGDVAVEVKIAGALEAALRQCQRYLANPRVGGIVLATTVSRHRVPADLAASTLGWEKPIGFAWVRAK